MNLHSRVLAIGTLLVGTSSAFAWISQRSSFARCANLFGPSSINTALHNSKEEGSSGLPADRRPPLRTVFKGCCVALRLEEVDGDLTKAVDYTCTKHGVTRVPDPHVTIIYWAQDIPQARRRFHERVKPMLRSWPALEVLGLLANRATSMSWNEVSFKASEEFKGHVRKVSNVIQDGAPGSSPHMSLAYDNPSKDSPLTAMAALDTVQEFPTLFTHHFRKVVAVELWNTTGTVDQWKPLDRHELR